MRVASGSELVEIATGGGAMVMLSAAVAVALALSLTWTVKFDVPEAVGEPVMAPAAESERPEGREPEVIDQAFPPVPPVAERDWLYTAPMVPLGSDDVVTVNCSGTMVMLSAALAVALALSLTWTVKFDVPEAVGEPVIAPAVESESPAGNEPAVVDQV